MKRVEKLLHRLVTLFRVGLEQNHQTICVSVCAFYASFAARYLS